MEKYRIMAATATLQDRNLGSMKSVGKRKEKIKTDDNNLEELEMWQYMTMLHNDYGHEVKRTKISDDADVSAVSRDDRENDDVVERSKDEESVDIIKKDLDFDNRGSM